MGAVCSSPAIVPVVAPIVLPDLPIVIQLTAEEKAADKLKKEEIRSVCLQQQKEQCDIAMFNRFNPPLNFTWQLNIVHKVNGAKYVGITHPRQLPCFTTELNFTDLQALLSTIFDQAIFTGDESHIVMMTSGANEAEFFRPGGYEPKYIPRPGVYRPYGDFATVDDVIKIIHADKTKSYI